MPELLNWRRMPRSVVMLAVLGAVIWGCGGAEPQQTAPTLMMAVSPNQVWVSPDGTPTTIAIRYEGTAAAAPSDGFGIGTTTWMAWPPGLEIYPDVQCAKPSVVACSLPTSVTVTAATSTQSGAYFFELHANAAGVDASTLLEVMVAP